MTGVIKIIIGLLLIVQVRELGATTDVPRLQLHVAQDVMIPGDELWFAAFITDGVDLSAGAPIIHISLQDLSSNELFHKSYRLDSKVISDFAILPFDIVGGSYVLSATIFNSKVQHILFESSRVIHVLGEDSADFYQFSSCAEDADIIIWNDPEESKKPKTDKYEPRQNLCQELDAKKLMLVTSSSLIIGEAMYVYDVGTSDYQTEYIMPFSFTTTGVRPFLFDASNFSIHQMSYQGSDNTYLLSMSDPIDDQKMQLVDAYTMLPIQGIDNRFPASKWTCLITESIVIEDSQELREKAIQRELVNRVYNKSTRSATPSTSLASELDEIEPDDQYVLSDYQVFESLELFIREAVLPVNLRNQKDQINLRMVSRDNRKYFEGEPLLIVDNKIVSSIEDILSIPYLDIRSMDLFRHRSLLDERFGIFGINGVLRINTKSGLTDASLIDVPGMSISRSYQGTVQNESSEKISVPNFLNVQYFGVAEGRFCYDHNDELGAFSIRQLNLMDGKQTTEDYEVILTQDSH